MDMEQKKRRHTDFWQGRGPSLILIPPHGDARQYDLTDYPRRFEDPRTMWEAEIARARQVPDWPTDGIPTVRPNLGVIVASALAGQDYHVEPNAMPWPGKPLLEETIRDAVPANPDACVVLQKAAAFYRVHREEGSGAIAGYLADTQGVFDIAHLLRGDHLFIDMADPEKEKRVHELLTIAFELYRTASDALKAALGEPDDCMIHGHATPQGIYFPHAGVRTAEDTATLLSPNMITQFVLPYVKKCAEPYNGLFVHYCGYHEHLFRQLAELPEVKAIDLGNPEKYDLEKLLRCSAETRTVLYSRVAAEPEEDWRSYIKRIGRLVRDTGARVALRPTVFPQTHSECRDMLDTWHEETI